MGAGGNSGAQEGVAPMDDDVLAHAGNALTAGAPKNRGGPRAGDCRSALQGKPGCNPAGESGVFPKQRQSNQAICSDQNSPFNVVGHLFSGESGGGAKGSAQGGAPFQNFR